MEGRLDNSIKELDRVGQNREEIIVSDHKIGLEHEILDELI